MKLRLFEKHKYKGEDRFRETNRTMNVATKDLNDLAQGVVIKHVRWVDSGKGITTETTELAGVFAGRRQLIGVFKV